MAKKRPTRGRKPVPKADRKDRLIQTRVPGDLDEILRDAAKKARLSVSQLVRNVLEDTFHLVDHVVDGAVKIGEQVKRDAQKIAESAQGKSSKLDEETD